MLKGGDKQGLLSAFIPFKAALCLEAVCDIMMDIEKDVRYEA
jgi:hypothetical protein